MENIYEKTVENSRVCKKLIEDTNRKIVDSIREKDPEKEKIYTHMLALHTGMYYESLILKLFYEEKSTLTKKEKDVINRIEAKKRVSYFFAFTLAKNNNIPLKQLESSGSSYLTFKEIEDKLKITLTEEEYKEFIYLVGIIENELESIINIRNKVAHGQVIHFMNSKNTNISEDSHHYSEKMNKHTLNQALKIIKFVCLSLEYNINSEKSMIELVTFNNKKIKKSIEQLKNPSFYEKDKKRIIDRYEITLKKQKEIRNKKGI